MTKKDYELIAKVFNAKITRLHATGMTGKTGELILLADSLATELKADNRAFDTDKFLNACGVLNNPLDPQSSQYIA